MQYPGSEQIKNFQFKATSSVPLATCNLPHFSVRCQACEVRIYNIACNGELRHRLVKVNNGTGEVRGESQEGDESKITSVK